MGRNRTQICHREDEGGGWDFDTFVSYRFREKVLLEDRGGVKRRKSIRTSLTPRNSPRFVQVSVKETI